MWPQILEEISKDLGAIGAALLQSDVRTDDIPVSGGVSDLFKAYFADGWSARDIRAERGIPLVLGGHSVVTDQDIITPEEMHRNNYYQDLLAPNGLTWWAVAGFTVGSHLWGLTIHRSARQGPFEATEKQALAQIVGRLSEVATLSSAVGRASIVNMTNALDLVTQPAIALDRMGFVLEANAAAERLFDHDVRVRNRRLELSDPRAKAEFGIFLRKLRMTPDSATLNAAPIFVRPPLRSPLVLRILPIDGAARSPFLGARALLLISDLGRKNEIQIANLLSSAFGLSPAEARLASFLADGASLDEAAHQFGISRETIRNQLKSVFAKTDTHRQSELVALLGRICFSA
jgi:DNA-binding CsgD family transcriptional regulator